MSRSWLQSALLCLALAMFVLPASAHVGSPDVYVEGNAGPYKLLVVVRPPLVIPGVADIELRSESPGIERIEITPIPLTGEAAKYPPVPDAMQRPSAQFFTGHLWLMATGSWQIRFTVYGSKGSGVFSAPVPATAIATRKMQPGLGVMLAILGIILVGGLVSIVGAATRDAQLAPGAEATPERRRRAYVAMTITLVLLIGAVVFGNRWWGAEAADYSRYIYKPLQMQAELKPGDVLDLRLSDPGWLKQRRLDDFIPDHDHVMHLYMLRWPAMDVVFHLHPEVAGPGDFSLRLPSVPAGNYRLYADVVHENGFPETIVGSITLPKISGNPLGGDDAEGTSIPLRNAGEPIQTRSSYKLPDGYTMVWKRPETLIAKTPYDFTFELRDPEQRPAAEMALYMGMPGHAAFIKSDGTVFAHIHPSGTASMAAMMIAQAQNRAGSNDAAATQNDMAAMPGMSQPGMPNTVSFPYGFPSPGTYRIIVQMKHGSVIETGFFDAEVAPVP
ncbi:MAG: hypothetical protein JOZ83_05145 [Silvibacterium sp.]|nr:hypothetical protein [Silvibacterium sp.]